MSHREEQAEEFPTVPEPRTGDPLRVDVLAGPSGTSTLRLCGEIDLATSPLLHQRAMDELAREPRQLVLDLRQVDFLGSSGLAALVEIRTEALRRGVGLRLVSASRAVLRPLIATRLLDLFDVDDASGGSQDGTGSG
ncbi:MAG TPA: STAS domain-containing protein [Pseudonocardiaceae bacterium]